MTASIHEVVSRSFTAQVKAPRSAQLQKVSTKVGMSGPALRMETNR